MKKSRLLSLFLATLFGQAPPNDVNGTRTFPILPTSALSLEQKGHSASCSATVKSEVTSDSPLPFQKNRLSFRNVCHCGSQTAHH